jgi:chromosome segregation ATPase
MDDKKKTLTILISIVILTSLGFNIYQQRLLKELRSDLDYCQSEKDDLENKRLDSEKELYECISQKDNYKRRSSYESFDNSYLESNNRSLEYDIDDLQNEKDDLERKVRDLESDLDDCERKLRDFN